MSRTDLSLHDAARLLLSKIREASNVEVGAEVHPTDDGTLFAVFFRTDERGEARSSNLAQYGDTWVWHCNRTDKPVMAEQSLRDVVAAFDYQTLAASLAHHRRGLIADPPPLPSGERHEPLQAVGRA